MNPGRHQQIRLPRIVVILPRGEAIRNFVYSGALDEVARHAELCILSVIPNDKIRQLLRTRYGQVVELEEMPERWLVGFTREILDMAHGRWLWSEAAKERWRLRDLEAVTPAQKFRRWWKKALCYPFANRTGLRALSYLESFLSWQLRTTDRYLRLLQEFRPNLVFNGSHVHSGVALPVVHASRALKVPTAAFIFSWDNLTSQGRIIPPYDYYLVWNNTLRDQLLKIYPSIHSKRVFVTGTPQFDFYFRSEYYWTREEFCVRVGADPNQPIVLYTTGMANHMPGEPRIVEGIADVLAEMTEFGPPQLLVRVYPKDQTGRFEDLRQRRPDILFPQVPWEPLWRTPLQEDLYLLTNMLKHAAVGINIASTISLELCMFNKPVINIRYNPPGLDISPVDYRVYYHFDHYAPIVRSKAVNVANNPEQLREMIKRVLRDPQSGSSKRNSLLRSMYNGTLDGKASLRVANTLCHITSENALD